MEALERVQFGDPVLREVSLELKADEILSREIQQLIKNMRHTLVDKKLGIALAAPRVGENIALVVVAVRPTDVRQDIEPFDAVLINPQITEKTGRRKSMW